MEYRREIHADSCVFVLSGSMTFDDHDKFRDVLAALENENYVSIVMDFKQVDFMDSAALGMLLLLRDKAKLAQKDVVIRSPNPGLMKVFKATQLDTLFNFA